MITVGIVDKNEKLKKQVKKVLSGSTDFQISDAKEGSFDIVLWNGFSKEPGKIAAKRLIVASDGENAVKHCATELAVSCGLHDYDTVTLSSVLSDGGMAAVTREIVSLSGKIKAPCELKMSGLSGEHALAILALLLVTDMI